MPTAKLFNMAGDQVGEVALSEAVFGVEPNESVLHDSVKNHLANCRQGTQSALTKGEVSYSTAKPWRQKGTGRARAGYKGSPVWTHGGVAFAPKPRDYSYTLNKKVKRLALKSALSAKAAAGEILVVDGMAVEEIKTAPVKAFLTKIGAIAPRDRVGALIAVVDALPVLGSGTVLLPWAAVSLLRGSGGLAIGLTVTYAAAAFARSALEPRLLGRQIGLPPLLTLLSLYAGYRLFGLAGMILLPLAVLLAKQVWELAEGNGGGIDGAL